MKTRAYYAKTVENLIKSLKLEYTDLMKKYMKDNDEEKVMRINQAIIALGILEDQLFEFKPIEIEVEV